MKHPTITIVVAMAENRVIGRNGGLPWRLPADLTRFRTLTMGKPIIMGRRTHESIGRALDGRRNIVITHHADYHAPGCLVATSLEAAFEAASSAEEISVIGGARTYEQALPFTSRMHLTLIHASIDGDVQLSGHRAGRMAGNFTRRTQRRCSQPLRPQLHRGDEGLHRRDECADARELKSSSRASRANGRHATWW